MKLKYGADACAERSTIQTSRSLHAQEIDSTTSAPRCRRCNAIYDNCNSLHTNAYDEVNTTPTEESVPGHGPHSAHHQPRAGLAKTKKNLQGSFIIEVSRLSWCRKRRCCCRIRPHGAAALGHGTMYQRGKIQEERPHEMLKSTGEYPIISEYLPPRRRVRPVVGAAEVIRATEEEKQYKSTCSSCTSAMPTRFARPAAPKNRCGQRESIRRADGNGEILLPRSDYERCLRWWAVSWNM
jgi:hypothetical protein